MCILCFICAGLDIGKRVCLFVVIGKIKLAFLKHKCGFYFGFCYAHSDDAEIF